MAFLNWLEMVSVGVTATAIGIPIGSFFKWLLKKLITNDQFERKASANNNANGGNPHGEV